MDANVDGEEIVLDSDTDEPAADYKKEELLRLRSGSLLSDYGIETYLALLAKEANKRFGTKVEVLSSQYIALLESKSHADATKYWKTRKDVVGADIVLWFLNPGGNHWTLMAIEPKKKRMGYYDSFLPETCPYFTSPTIRNFCDAEAEMLGALPFNWNEWTFHIHRVRDDIPEQFNGTDCGVFVMQYAYCLLLKTPMVFKQAQMPHVRNVIATEIEEGKIYDREMLQSLQNTANESTYNSPNHMSEGSPPKDSSDPSNSPIVFPTGKQDLHNEPTAWVNLSKPLQELLPNESGITYVVTEMETLPTEKFLGAPANAYRATIRINITHPEKAQEWLQNMMKHSKCTYRHTRGRAPGLKRVLYKVEMHCQHKEKSLTLKQKQKAAEMKSKQSKKPLVQNIRRKKTGCPSTLKLTVTVPTKKETHASARPYLVSHPTILQVSFTHNHPLESAHVLAFRPIASETKESFFELFRKGHTAASAFHWNETKLYLDGGEDQISLADRAVNPTKKDVSRLYSEWQKRELGSDNGKSLFDRLDMEINSYNEANAEIGGKAKLQRFEKDTTDSESDMNDELEPPKRKKPKTNTKGKPMILAVCTPLMCRVHENIQQAGEMTFCDATSSLDRFNTSLFILSTSHPAGGLPLGVIITSDEQEETIRQGLELLKEVLPKHSFYGRGVERGPGITMTDDSSAERNALHNVWPEICLLLCVFHFLQRRWTWLHNGENRIANQHRQILINKVKQLVYADTQQQLKQRYTEFQSCEVVKLYPHFLAHIQGLWERQKEWAICYRRHLLTRGNQTNNYAEAGIRILKELVFSRVKAYNLVQMFSFVTECLELYYIRKLLSVAHNRIDRYISLKYQGLRCVSIAHEHIRSLDENNLTFLVDSLSERGVKYLVDMQLGTCSCTAGQDGSPCSHQAAVVQHHHIPSVNCIPTLVPEVRQQLAAVAMGSKAIRDQQFYSCLHQKEEELNKVMPPGPPDDQPDFSGTQWDLIRAQAASDVEDDQKMVKDEGFNAGEIAAILRGIDEFSDDLKKRVKENEAVAQGAQTLVRRYKAMHTCKFANAKISSALHRFGWVFGGSIQSTQGGYFRRGRRIPVNAQAAGRRRGGSKGKARAASGRPAGMTVARFPASRYTMCARRPPKGKRIHSLTKNIAEGLQNGGKW